jgi:hypothetical protein
VRALLPPPRPPQHPPPPLTQHQQHQPQRLPGGHCAPRLPRPGGRPKRERMWASTPDSMNTAATLSARLVTSATHSDRMGFSPKVAAATAA